MPRTISLAFEAEVFVAGPRPAPSREGARSNCGGRMTMIEVPRAALTADQIAECAEFFSFGTNDLTQTTFGISRDDAEASFLLEYLEKGILAKNPFATLDEAGVGKLMQMAVMLG